MSNDSTVITHETSPHLAHQFEAIEQQRDASRFGMWVFLGTELMFFGGLFLCYANYRYFFPAEFKSASSFLNATIGAANTAILICSSFTMAMGVWAAENGRRRMLMTCLALTMALGTAFLVIKGYEWHEKYVEQLIPGYRFRIDIPNVNFHDAQMFFILYFGMTGLHGLHVIVGIVIMAFMLYYAWKNVFSEEYYHPIEITGLYWHFVDIVWIFLFPLLYLVHRS